VSAAGWELTVQNKIISNLELLNAGEEATAENYGYSFKARGKGGDPEAGLTEEQREQWNTYFEQKSKKFTTNVDM
jgi:hypothetical protein